MCSDTRTKHTDLVKFSFKWQWAYVFKLSDQWANGTFFGWNNGKSPLNQNSITEITVIEDEYIGIIIRLEKEHFKCLILGAFHV